MVTSDAYLTFFKFVCLIVKQIDELVKHFIS